MNIGNPSGIPYRNTTTIPAVVNIGQVVVDKNGMAVDQSDNNNPEYDIKRRIKWLIYAIVLKSIDDGGSETINGVISFDLVKSFSESRSATVSTQTVEKGFNISDNINIEPVQFTLDGYISSYYLKDDESEIVWDGRLFSQPLRGHYLPPSH